MNFRHLTNLSKKEYKKFYEMYFITHKSSGQIVSFHDLGAQVRKIQDKHLCRTSFSRPGFYKNQLFTADDYLLVADQIAELSTLFNQHKPTNNLLENYDFNIALISKVSFKTRYNLQLNLDESCLGSEIETVNIKYNIEEYRKHQDKNSLVIHELFRSKWLSNPFSIPLIELIENSIEVRKLEEMSKISVDNPYFHKRLSLTLNENNIIVFFDGSFNIKYSLKRLKQLNIEPINYNTEYFSDWMAANILLMKNQEDLNLYLLFYPEPCKVIAAKEFLEKVNKEHVLSIS